MEWLEHLAVYKHKDGIIVNGMYQGVHVSRDVLDNTIAIYNFTNGKRNGYYYRFYQNGVLKSKLHYVDGRRHGIQLEYNTDGHLQYRENFNHGKLHGIQTEWDRYGFIDHFNANKYHKKPIMNEILYYD